MVFTFYHCNLLESVQEPASVWTHKVSGKFLSNHHRIYAPGDTERYQRLRLDFPATLPIWGQSSKGEPHLVPYTEAVD